MPGTSSGRHGEPSRSMLVWCQGPRPGEDSDSAHSSSTTTPPPRRRPPSRPRDSVSVSSPSSTTQYTVIFHPSPSVPPVSLQDATQVSHQPQSPQQAKFAGPHDIYKDVQHSCTHMRVDEPEVSHAQDKHSLSPSKTRSSKSDTDAARPRNGLTSPFIRGTTFPAIFPSTHHLALHRGAAYKLG